jgi:hypothetical protein
MCKCNIKTVVCVDGKWMVINGSCPVVELVLVGLNLLFNCQEFARYNLTKTS